MGEVFAAQQDHPIRRKVALKLIKPGMDSKQVIARFESERQALALMTHACIAQVFEAGTTARGRPYFAMEYVPGVPITTYCDECRLSTRERLALFLQVCDAIQHAHQKGIIHRDLKPSNVLVTTQNGEAVPKVIDFGVAKAMAQPLTERTLFTELGVMVGTPEYMSPEQAESTRHDVDTRTDVYSLGVILYELLVGALPFDPKDLRQAGFDEIRRRIRESEPSKPSTRVSTLGEGSAESASRRRTSPAALRRQLSGDLDWITMKALEKERSRRYASASELAADLARHIRNEPVTAGPPGAAYRTAKFVRRHRVGVTVAALLAVSLVLGSTGTVLGLLRSLRAERLARDEAQRASTEAETATQVSEFLVDLFHEASPRQSRGEDVTVLEVLDRGADKLARELSDQPVVRARLLSTLGAIYMELGALDKAPPLLEEALTVELELLGERNLDTATTLVRVASLHNQLGELHEALGLLKRALVVREDLLGPDHLEVAVVLNMIANVQGERLDLRQRTLDILEKNLGRDDPGTFSARTNLALELYWRGQVERAEELYKLNVAIAEANGEMESVGIILSLMNLATQIEADRDRSKAIELAERALAISRKMYKDEHPWWSAFPLGALARLYADGGDLDKARPLMERALALIGPKERPGIVHGMARLHDLAGETEKARRLYESELAALEERYGPEHRLVATMLHDFSHHHRDHGNVSDAIPLLERAVRIMRADVGETTGRTVHQVIDLARCYGEVERYDEAHALLLGSLEAITQEDDKSHRQLPKVLFGLASLAAVRGRRTETLDLLGRAVNRGWADKQLFEDTVFDSLRGDPEFVAIAARVRERLGDE